MSESILNSTKKSLGLAESYTAFDPELIMHINTILGVLNQIGIGPGEGLAISDATTTWDALIDTDIRYNPVKTYMYLRVRMLFDPPTTSYLIEASQEQAAMLEWRLSTLRESVAWIDPTPAVVGEDVYDGGQP
jgi:hypothetical protein